MSWVLWAKYLVIVGVCGLWLARRGFRRRDGRRRWLLDLHRDESGTGVLEFTLTFFPFMTICMITAQFMLIINAYMFVKYAAYYATRSAIVIIAEKDTDGGRNHIGSDKKKRICEAAALAVSPVSPMTLKWPPTSITPTYWLGVGNVLGTLASQSIGTRLVQYENAYYQTSITVARDAGSGSLNDNPSTVNAFDTIVVKVAYHFYLAIPLGNLLSTLDILTSWPAGLGQPTVELKAQCAMMNEGAKELPSL